MGLKLITPPDGEPVTLEELKHWSRVDFDDDDALIAANGAAAREFCETATGKQFVAATWELTTRSLGRGPFVLPKPPLRSVESIAYRDMSGALQVLDPSEYLVAPGEPGTVEPVSSWPATANRPDAVVITFEAGYGDAAAVPDKIKVAIKGLAAHWYDQREGVTNAEGFTRRVPMHVRSLILQAKDWRAA
ncbi:head-tail connector protein [Nitratireductor sp. ZSWI3]|uniref:head-tail connector protein n=1 Tax=Nitratireductor sp. ZSWI3 TaxID=2966359 RepID=UPI0021502E7F|nr:head-tail connector protein [Nitratireductor sp. ZSWI3]MCR4267087.1 head-tail connector protein [Nitratireductor sp. ZSWI3]